VKIQSDALARDRSVKTLPSLTFAALAIVGTALGVAIACAPVTRSAKPPVATRPSRAVQRTQAGTLAGHDRVALIALSGGSTAPSVSATGPWQVDEQGGRARLVQGNGREAWRVERKGGLLRVSSGDGDATPWREGPFVARAATSNAFVQYNGKRYRGELWFTATDSGVMVVNRLEVEEYLRGVVPLELGTRSEIDRAALEAQAIAARSYTYIRVPDGDGPAPRNGWHMVATVANQVYGGVDAEAPVVNAAVDATSGLVIRYGGLLVDAPYFSSCGGRTAAPNEVWRDARNEPYLPGIDDTNPSTGKPYCNISPRAGWTADFDESALAEIVARHLTAAGARNPTVPAINDLRVVNRSASGRVTTLKLTTDRGDVTVSANEIRSVFRDVRGAILSSTYFSVDRESHERGHLTGVTLRGAGNGHGVGMCQWGAIGRARAGQDFRTILRAYYPGTVVGFVD
jgi:stage II sporulation protein D